MKIMICLDPTEDIHDEILQVAAAHVAAYKCEALLVVSHVADDKDYPKRIEPTTQMLARANASFQDQGLCCTPMITFRGFEEDRGEHLLAVAQEHGVDEIIVGVKNRSRLGKVLLGSVAQFLILNAGCPVVTVRKPDKGII